MSDETVELMAVAGTACRDVAMLTAMALIREHGDGEAAIAMLAEFSARTPPEPDELDAAAIAALGIHDAMHSWGVEPR